MKKIIIILILLFLTGCDYIELNDLSIIKSIAIDYQNNEYSLYAEIIDEINDKNKPTTKIIDVNGKDIKECFKNLIIRSNKTIHYSHIDLLILSTNLNNDNLNEIFSYFLESKNFRNDFMTISSTDIKTLINDSKYDEIEQLVKNNQHKELINIDIEEVIKNYLNNNTITLSLFEYENDDVLYKYNVRYKNNITERINNYEQEKD